MSPTKQARRDSGKLKSNFCQIQHFELLEVFCPLTTNGLLVVIFNSPLFPHPKECWEILALLNIAAMTVIRVTKNMCAFSLSFWGMKGFFFYPLASVANWVGDGMDPVQEVPWPLYLHKLRNGSVSVMLMRSTVDLFGLYVLAIITRLSA